MDAGPLPPEHSSPVKQRWTFRNDSDAELRLRFYNPTDVLRVATLPNGNRLLAARSEVALPEREFSGALLPTITAVTVCLDGHLPGGAHEERAVSAGELVTISEEGVVEVVAYVPPDRGRSLSAERDANSRDVRERELPHE